jgi:hypothetical protein
MAEVNFKQKANHRMTEVLEVLFFKMEIDKKNNNTENCDLSQSIRSAH